eukprot:TRINITY_DN21846_c0_g1_i1.p1 TRINITY_DN21846_c0_g1~~TRINITY_DN21846_c0_g1_i1.p1  ORF type:complete len:194 (+),score=6.33 TRINITY_DN21846_c0_g1_i1:65-583(+)
MRIRPLVTINIALEDSAERVMTWGVERHDRQVDPRYSPLPPSMPYGDGGREVVRIPDQRQNPQVHYGQSQASQLQHRPSSIRETTIVAERETSMVSGGPVGHSVVVNGNLQQPLQPSTYSQPQPAPLESRISALESQMHHLLHHPPQHQQHHRVQPPASPQIPSGSVTHYYY